MVYVCCCCGCWCRCCAELMSGIVLGAVAALSSLGAGNVAANTVAVGCVVLLLK